MNSIVDQIKERLPITDVLGSYITLIPGGKQYKARCPFHNERTPSFSVSPDRGFYYCFGCGAKGDIFTFVQEFEGLDFNGALKVLAQRAGVELTRRDQRREETSELYECLEAAATRYQLQLGRNSEALAYLEKRGLSRETIEQFRLGYAPDEWRFVADACKDEKERRIAERAGLIKRPEGGDKEKCPYDRFRGRIMFPLADASGRVVGFSGRIFPEAPEGPKYLNSPETEVFHKSKVLYGFDKAKGAIKKAGFSILVEGQMDLLLSHQSGFKNTVATSGTAISEPVVGEATNMTVLSRLSPNILFAFDGDEAGQKALTRAALVALSLSMNPRVVSLPEGVDPAEYLLTEGGEKWKAQLAHNTHFILYQAQAIRHKGLSPHLFVQALRAEVFPFISRIPSPIEKQLHVETVAKELSLERSDLIKELELFVAQQPALTMQSEAPQEHQTDSVALSPSERYAAFALRFPEAVAEQGAEESDIFSFDTFTESPRTLADERRDLALALIEQDYSVLNAAQEQLLAARELRKKAYEAFLLRVHSALSRALREAERAEDEKETARLLGALAQLHTVRAAAEA